ncbi:hypothetical protein EDB81DRAFT_819858 [Dactylonectria macrodidyma]|uniref:Uncharacterized protein n=1 Tax=Dactylonectria macrodidyma TaxID=307937 RepID=A0A9P9DAS1_9HYPO|nr:hypothetical protein EDB81DRAFT_819858 [Dactylonectria macrodidyma]
MRPTFTFAVTAIAHLFLLRTAQAAYTFTEHEDLVGVLSDTIVPTAELCESPCDENELCLYSLYHRECNECWQMDCSADDGIWSNATEYKKITGQEFYYYEDDMRPEMPEDGCANLTATVLRRTKMVRSADGRS